MAEYLQSYGRSRGFFRNRDGQLSSHPDHSFSCISIEDFSDVSSSIPFSPVIHVDEPPSFPILVDDSPVTMFRPVEQKCPLISESDITLDDPVLMVNEIEDISDWLASESSPPALHNFPGDDAGSLLREVSIGTLMNQTSLILPGIGMEFDNQLSILHLLKAYGEAEEMETKELAGKIMSQLKEKACPFGSTVERLAYYMIQALEGEVDFLWKEASKNYEAAFKTFYQIFPYGRFSHFTANSVILEALPEDADIVHIVDFDVGQGVQWPPMIEDLARRRKRMVRLIGMKWQEEEDRSGFTSTRRSEEMKTRLYEHAKTFGLRLKTKEMDKEALVTEMKKTKKRGIRSEWLAFNCAVGLSLRWGKGRVLGVLWSF